MGLLDGITGGALGGMIPGMELLDVVSKGLDLMKGLFEKGDLGGTQKLLDFLNQLISKQGEQGAPAAPAEQQPFNLPQQSGQSNMPMEITIKIAGAAGSQAQPVPHSTLPFVDGSAQGDQKLSDAARPFVDGSDAAKNRALTPGSKEWTTVMWAMQQNPNVHYNADSQRFTMKMSDGSDRDLCSLQEAQDKISSSGGFDRGNPTAATELGKLLGDKVQQAEQSPSASSIVLTITNQAGSATAHNGEHFSPEARTKKLDHIKSQLQQIEEALKMMQHANDPGALDLQLNVSA